MSLNLTKLNPEQLLKLLSGSSKALRDIKKVNPRDRYVLLCPDSDRFFVGLGNKLLTNKASENVFRNASRMLDRDILRLCVEGPKETLEQSVKERNIATFVCSQAAIEGLRETDPKTLEFCKGSGGFGVGFLNCLVFSGSMSFEDALEFVAKEGEAIDKVSKVVPSATLRVRLKPGTSISRLCRAAMEECLKKDIPEQVAVCSVTKYISPNVMLVSGHEEAIKYLEQERIREEYFYRMVRLEKLPLALHTNMMDPVRKYIEAYIDDKQSKNEDYIRDPESCSVQSAVSGKRLKYAMHIKSDLINRTCRPSLVHQVIGKLFDRPTEFAQPNTLVIWDKSLLKSLELINRKARQHAKLIVA